MKWLIAPIVVSVLVVAISFGCERPGYGNRLAQEHAGRAIAVMARHTARLGKHSWTRRIHAIARNNATSTSRR
jgi:hypothetical protein